MTTATADPVGWAATALRQQGLTVRDVNIVGTGTEAVVRRISSLTEDGRTAEHALKTFRRERRSNSAQSIRSEFEALAAFSAAVAAPQSCVVCPRPVALSPDEFAYLMSYVEGETLDDYLARNRGRSQVVACLAAAIVDGLACFYDALGTCYADFEPRNVLVTPSRVCLLDPMIGNPAFLPLRREFRYWPSSVDLGFWLEQVAAQAVKPSLQRPTLAASRLSLTRRLIRQAAEVFAPGDATTFRHEVVTVAEFHFERFRRHIGARWTIHYAVGRRIARHCANGN